MLNNTWPILPSQEFTRVPEPSDWQLFSQFADRVKLLAFTSSENLQELGGNVCPIIECAIRNHEIPSPILKNLRGLHCTEFEENSLWVVHSFLGHRLTEFSLLAMASNTTYHPGHSTLACRTIIDALRIRCPSLEHLTILSHGHERILDLNSAISLLVSSLQCLRHLDTGYFKLTPQNFIHLASLPHLRTLRMIISDEMLVHTDWLTLCHRPFSPLDHMAIEVESMQIAVDFVNLLKAVASLRIIYISVVNAPTVHWLRQLFLKLVDRCMPSAPTEIDILHCDAELEIDGGPDDYCLERFTIEPLFSFVNLEIVKINTAFSLTEVNDTLLKDMAVAWPKLRVFHIALTKHMGIPKVTLDGLAFLADCRDLADLSVPFDSGPCAHAFKGLPQNSLYSMVLANSSLADPHKLVCFLSEVFPSLSKIECYEDPSRGDQPDDISQNWQQTKDLFLKLHLDVDVELAYASEDSESE